MHLCICQAILGCLSRGTAGKITLHKRRKHILQQLRTAGVSLTPPVSVVCPGNTAPVFFPDQVSLVPVYQNSQSCSKKQTKANQWHVGLFWVHCFREDCILDEGLEAEETAEFSRRYRARKKWGNEKSMTPVWDASQMHFL